jgi:PAS domain S-box-containing protein
MTHEIQRVQAELVSLQKAYGDLEASLNASFDEIFVTDGAGVTLHVNSACERLYGVKARDLVGCTVADLEQRKIFSPSATLVALEEKRRITLLQRTSSGRMVLVTANPLTDEAGRIIRVVCNSRDVTELMYLQAKVAEEEERAAKYRKTLLRMRLRGDGLPETEEMVVPPGLEVVAKRARKVAAVDSTVLLQGESGVGKDLVAAMIHQASPRHRGPFVKVNCGAIPDNLLESEMFGHERGAFTGALKDGRTGYMELAHGGTLFLNEVAELPLNLQVKLLQAIQDRCVMRVGGSHPIKVDIRIVAATNRNLADMVARGELREDLYYRLNVVPLHIPALRQRPNDIVYLALHFLSGLNRRYGLQQVFAPEALQALSAYGWPGNVRELANVIERIVVMGEQELISREMVLAAFSGGVPEALPREASPVVLPMVTLEAELPLLRDALAGVEAALVMEAYRRHQSTYGVSRALGISQATAVRKVQKYSCDSKLTYHIDSNMN